MPRATTQPDYYEGVLSEESSLLRGTYEKRLERLYVDLPEAKGVTRLRILKEIDRVEESLSWQGANPKQVPFADLKAHIRYPNSEDPIENKYQARIGNRATAIRAFCVWCQGGHVAGVKECPSVTCPLHSFRMGTDPLRGFDLPKAAPVVLPEDEEPDDQFEEGEDDAEPDATE